MTTLNIITRCSRMTNIRQIFDSLNENNNFLKIKWFVLFDLSSLIEIPSEILIFLKDKAQVRFYETSSGDFGHQMINQTLDEIDGGLIYILDDDNIIHPNFFRIINDWQHNYPHLQGLIFSQKVGGIDFSGLDIREADISNVVVGKIDMAQFCLQRELIGDHRIPIGYYVGDGIFIESLFNEQKESFLINKDVGCYYNYFKQFSNKDYFLPRILVVGDTDIDYLKTYKWASFEDDRLVTKFLPTDNNVTESISNFKPNGILTIGESWDKFQELSKMSYDIRRKWIHINHIEDSTGENIFNTAHNSMLEPFYGNQPLISVFTPTFNTKEMLWRTYNSLTKQTYDNWEWVIVDDSNDGGRTLKVCLEIEKKDPRVKVYDFRKKSGGVVGESKYRAACLCQGLYLVELDHDDILLPDALKLTVEAFRRYPDAKFVYSDCAEIDENHQSLTYGDGFAFGYGTYRDEKWDNIVYKTVNTQNINPKTIRHIVGVPNHLRAWDRFFYHSIGGHNRFLSIADDYELIVRSFLHTKFVRIPKLLYLQFFHQSNTQNDSRADIQRRVRTISNHYNQRIKNRFEELGLRDWAYEENPQYPLNTPSKFGEDECAANYIFEIHTIQDSNFGYYQNDNNFLILN